jgi:cysteine sulfinate desulfinase/cysteine desulfurase-like protein
VEPSHVLLAQGYTREEASSFVRFSLDRDSTEEEVGYVVEVFPGLVRRIRGAG